MSIAALPPLGAAALRGTAGAAARAPGPDAPSGPDAPTGPGFGSLLGQGLQQVSSLERAADAAATGFAVGDGTKVHEVMTAGAKSQLAVEVLAQLRNRAVEAYAEIMRLQV